MNISIDNLRQLSSLEIYELLKSELDNFYNNYNNIIISYGEFKEIALEEIEESKYDPNIFNDNSSLLLKRIDRRIKIESEISKDENYKVLWNEIRKYNVLSQEEFDYLIVKAQNNDKEARDRIIKCNIKLVISIAKRFLGYGVELDDLIQEGTFGLYTAVEKFDASKGFRFSTYATWWIRSYLYKTIYSTGRNIKIPSNQISSIIKYKKAYRELFDQLGREPYIEEIADKLNIPLEKCIQLYKLQVDTVSLNKKVYTDEGEDTELGDYIESSEDVEFDIIGKSLKDDVKNALNAAKLTKKEYYVIVNRFELFGCEKKTLEEIGKEINVTRERVRQIENKALLKLKRSFSVRSLKNYIKEDNNIFNYAILENNTNINNLNNTKKLSTVKKSNTNDELFVKENDLCKKLKCTKEELDLVKLQLNQDELDLLTQRENINYLYNMKLNDIARFNREVILTIRRILKTIKKESIDSPYSEKMLELEKTLGEELFNKIKELFNTSVFNEFRKYFTLKGSVVALMVFGYVDDTYYTPSYISNILKISLDDVEKVYNKANLLFKTNNVLKEDKESKMIKELKKN